MSDGSKTTIEQLFNRWVNEEKDKEFYYINSGSMSPHGFYDDENREILTHGFIGGYSIGKERGIVEALDLIRGKIEKHSSFKGTPWANIMCDILLSEINKIKEVNK